MTAIAGSMTTTAAGTNIGRPDPLACHRFPGPDSRMAVRIVRLGTPRAKGEGLRLGTVRRPPRGVPRAEFARRDFYDLWFPEVAPSTAAVAQALRATTDREWAAFERRYRRELSAPGPRRALELLAALSRQTDFSVGCYCEDEARCHRSILRQRLRELGARLA